MINVKLIIEQLKSWGSSYIPPSAKITMDDAARLLISMDEEIRDLKLRLESLETKSTEPTKPATAKAPPRKRTKKVV